MLTKKDKHLAAAQKFLERGQPDRALEEFARVVEEDPNDTRTRLKMAEIHAQRGDLPRARDIYLATAEIYLGQGFLEKAATVYKSVLKLMPRQPAVRERLGDTYRQLGRVADALRELDLAATEFAEAGRPVDALPALRRIVGLHPDNVVSRIKLAEMASQIGATDEAVHELRHAAEQLKHQGRTDEYVRVAERLLHHRPDDFALARELAGAYIARRNPRLAVAKLQGPLRAAPRDPQNVTLFAEALALIDPSKAISVWRELAEIHDAAGRSSERDACIRAALALDPTDGETRELAAHWGVSAGNFGRSRATPPPLPLPLAHFPTPGSGIRSAPGRSGTGDSAPGVPAPGVSSSGVSSSGVPGLGLSGLIAPTTPATDVQRILSEADVFVKYGLAERAVDHLRRVFTVYPHHRGARERLANVLNQLGRKREAAAELATLAAQLAADGDADAPGVAERALSLDPSSAAAAGLLGRQAAPPPPATRASRPPSLPSAGAGATPMPEDLTAELEQVDFFREQSLFDEARAALDELEERFPRHARLAEKRRSLEAGAAGSQPGAVPGHPPPNAEPVPVAKLDASERADPGTHGDLGIAYKQMGLFDAAIVEFKQAVRDKARAVFALTMIGECQEAKGELGEAVARYKEALNMPQVTPTESLELYYLLGGVFERLGDTREALYFFENLGKRDPRFRDVQRRIAALKPQRAERV